MTPQLTECLTSLCRALRVESLPVGEVVMVEGWLGLPGFTPDRLSTIIHEQQAKRGRINSARYFDPIVRETFVVSRETVRPPVRLLAERPWPDYLAHYTAHYGEPDALALADLRCRWKAERQHLGLAVEDGYAIDDPCPRLRAGAVPTLRPFPSAE